MNQLSSGSKRHQKRQNEDLEWKLRLERDASTPFNQFQNQVAEEKHRLMEAQENNRNLSRTGRKSGELDYWETLKRNIDYENQAIATVKDHWIQQGIWDKKWSEDLEFINARWKHEGFLKEKLWRLKTLFHGKEPRPQSSFQPSRPAAQFWREVVLEMERILGQESDSSLLTEWEVDSRAIEKVKAVWVERGIWNEKWDKDWPGPCWKHEEPFDEDPADFISVTAALGRDRHRGHRH
jgi:hypothetical protein